MSWLGLTRATTMLSMYYKYWLEMLDIPYHVCNGVPFPDKRHCIHSLSNAKCCQLQKHVLLDFHCITA